MEYRIFNYHGTEYHKWLADQQRYADLWLRKFLRVRKNLLKDIKPFDPDKNLACCKKCHVAFWGWTEYCPKHKRYGDKKGYKRKYQFYYDSKGNKIPA